MSFTPYTNYKVAFPSLKPGYIIKIQDKYYMVITARHNRPLVTFTSLQTKLELDKDTKDSNNVSCEDLAGELTKERIVNIQYLAIDASTPSIYWGTEPMMSKDVDRAIDTIRVGVSNPIAVDRWSYDPSMHLLITQGATTINYYFEIMEYEVTPYAGTPPMPYLQIMANGQAILVEASETQDTLSLLQKSREKKASRGK